MLKDLFVTTLALSLIIGVRYLLVGVVTHGLLWAGKGRGRQLNHRPPVAKRIRAEVIASLIACPIYALPAAFVIELWKRGGTAIYDDIYARPLWWLPVSFIVYMLAHDAFYYWVHRGLHHPRIFPWGHAEHHRSRDPSAFASFAFDPAEAIATAWFLPALTLFIPIHWGVALALLTLMTATAVLNHAGREVWPASWLKRAPPALDDYRHPPRRAPQTLQRQLRPVFPDVGQVGRQRHFFRSAEKRGDATALIHMVGRSQRKSAGFRPCRCSLSYSVFLGTCISASTADMSPRWDCSASRSSSPSNLLTRSGRLRP